MICLGGWGFGDSFVIFFSRLDLFWDLGIWGFFPSRFVWGFGDFGLFFRDLFGDLEMRSRFVWGFVFSFLLFGDLFFFAICLGSLGILGFVFLPDLFGIWGFCFFHDLFGDLGIWFVAICLGIFGFCLRDLGICLDLFLFRDSFGDLGICVFFYVICLGFGD